MSSRYTEAHRNTKGPGDSRPTALQIIKDEELEGKLKDKVFLITGCSSGIGIETARALAETGARLFLGVRNLAKGEAACGSFLEPGRVELIEVDTSSLASVRSCVAAFLERSQRLNILICNAGIMMNPAREVSPDGFELQLATNYLGHFLLFWLLREALLRSSTPEFNSRVVSVSSSGHQASPTKLEDLNLEGEGSYAPSVGYGNSKTAQIWMSSEIDRRYGSQGLHATALMPGGIATGLQVHWSEERKSSVFNDPQAKAFMKSVEQGAATTVFAAVGKEWEGRGGRYLENCAEAGPAPPDTTGVAGYANWAYDEAKERTLWKKTIEMLGLKDDGKEMS